MIHRIVFENWGPYDSFEYTLDQGGNFLLGNNYTGKTTILLGISAALVGEIPFEGKQEVRKYVLKGEETASLQVEFEHAGQAYSVRRNFSAKSLRGAFLYDAAGTELATGWDDVTQKVLECCGVQSPYFFAVSFMPEGYIYRFLEKPVKGILDEIDRIVGLEKLHQLSKTVKTTHTSLKNTTKRFRDELKNAPDTLEENLDTLQVGLTAAETRRDDIQTSMDQLKTLQTALTTANHTKTATWNKISETQKKLRTITGSLDGRTYLD